MCELEDPRVYRSILESLQTARATRALEQSIDAGGNRATTLDLSREHELASEGE